MKRKIVAVLLAVSMMNTTLIGCGDNAVSKNEGLDLSAEDDDYDYVDWDGNELLSLLPDPNSSKVKSKQVDSNTARLIVYEVSKSGFNKYIELCADNGFSTDSKSVSDDTGAMYKASNDTGYSLTLAYDPDDKAMGIRIDAPNSSDQEEVDSTPTPTETPTQQKRLHLSQHLLRNPLQNRLRQKRLLMKKQIMLMMSLIICQDHKNRHLVYAKS